MNTAFLLMAQYNGQAIIPLERVCADYFSHLTPDKLQRKVATGEVDLPVVRIEGSQKAAKGVHLSDLAAYLDEQRRKAVAENDKLHGRFKRAS
ncbi:Pyocin activator protein PrtN [Stutzerimonas decontaminans]|uniref:Pyocin activator protein PrtN n=1 Tax=Stutzerimonas decontaminans TaxID=3022791 RepID=A0ABX4VXU8_9GAMM|nr:pyocin activator PrtN family protein [Stutzerimonas decontaminans]MCQ4245589.1 pyocin activator PrtN family protein [Stutzerimonas decontaminans]PNF85020.1 Pyocin activator protein PrtN [Stutzerimonas decontaminans]